MICRTEREPPSARGHRGQTGQRGQPHLGVLAVHVLRVADGKEVLDVVPVLGVVDGADLLALVVRRSRRPDVVARVGVGEALPGAALCVVLDEARRLEAAVHRVDGEGVAGRAAAHGGEDLAVRGVAPGVVDDDGRLGGLAALAAPVAEAILEVFAQQRKRGGRELRLARAVEGCELLEGQ